MLSKTSRYSSPITDNNSSKSLSYVSLVSSRSVFSSSSKTFFIFDFSPTINFINSLKLCVVLSPNIYRMFSAFLLRDTFSVKTFSIADNLSSSMCILSSNKLLYISINSLKFSFKEILSVLISPSIKKCPRYLMIWCSAK